MVIPEGVMTGAGPTLGNGDFWRPLARLFRAFTELGALVVRISRTWRQQRFRQQAKQ
jgi:hypothetical protein